MNTQNQSPIARAVAEYEGKTLTKFTPSAKFYDSLKINRIRFWQLVEGKKEPFLSEAQRISEFFGVPLNQLVA